MIIDTELAATPTNRQQALTLVGTWASALFATAVTLVLTLRDLRPPHFWSDPSEWDLWASQHEPNELVAALVAPAALVLVCTLAATVVGVGAAVAVATRHGRSVRCSDRWPAAAAGFVAAVTLLAGGPASASTGSGARAGDDVAERPVVELVGATAPTTTSDSTTTSVTTTTSAPTTTRAPSTSATSTTVAVPTTLRPGPPTTARPTQEPPPDLARPSSTTPAVPTVVVRRGDNLWQIAEQQVAADPRNGPTLRYWLRLIDANQSRFVEPDNPSLIFPGQVLALPSE